MNKSITWSLVLLIIVAALYRIIPDRALGFAPQIAMAIFAGAIIKDKRWAFALPIFSIFLSDLLYQILYINGLTELSGFYDGQFANYLLFAAITLLGLMMKKASIPNIFGYSILGATAFFLASNFLVWINGAGYARAKTLSGLYQCYIDGLPFYRGSIYATLLFSALLFGGYYLLTKPSPKIQTN